MKTVWFYVSFQTFYWWFLTNKDPAKVRKTERQLKELQTWHWFDSTLEIEIKTHLSEPDNLLLLETKQKKLCWALNKTHRLLNVSLLFALTVDSNNGCSCEPLFGTADPETFRAGLASRRPDQRVRAERTPLPFSSAGEGGLQPWVLKLHRITVTTHFVMSHTQSGRKEEQNVRGVQQTSRK